MLLLFKLGQRFGLVLLILLPMVLTEPYSAQAASGVPGSPKFGIGAIVYPKGPYVKDALAMAADLGLDWMSVPVDWDTYQLDSANPPVLKSLDPIMNFALKQQIPVLVSISRAPAWARTSKGPDPILTARFVAAVAQRYPQAVQAVELFPGANTQAGWGGQPDPLAYYRLFIQVHNELQNSGSQVLLVAAGLEPLAQATAIGDLDDLDFLKNLYQQGASRTMPVISIYYGELTGDPTAFPDNSEQRVFRHYEEVRRVMVKNGHQNGSLWITHLSLPSGTIRVSDSAYQNDNEQSVWMSQAYIQTRSQLYIGVTIGQSLNPEPEETASRVPSLLGSNGQNHPFYSVLREMISLNKAGEATIQPGRSKEGSLIKNRP